MNLTFQTWVATGRKIIDFLVKNLWSKTQRVVSGSRVAIHVFTHLIRVLWLWARFVLSAINLRYLRLIVSQRSRINNLLLLLLLIEEGLNCWRIHLLWCTEAWCRVEYDVSFLQLLLLWSISIWVLSVCPSNGPAGSLILADQLLDCLWISEVVSTFTI